MTALTAPKGPLPARVYWFRRLTLLAVVFLLIFGAARLLGGSSDQEPETGVTATTVSGEPKDQPGAEAGADAAESPAESPAEGAESPAPATTGGQDQQPVVETPAPSPTPPPLPEPTGPCANEDVVVTPVLGEVRGGGQVEIGLNLRTKTTPACTWQVSGDTVTVKITSGSDDIWQSRHCPQVLPAQDVVIYQASDTVVPMRWNGRRSSEDCSAQNDWARVGFYHVVAAAYAGEPTDVQFELRVPLPVVETRTVAPEPEKVKKNKKKNKNKTQSTPSVQPSGAVEPNDPS
ncbi:hypothetical protein [Nocardioides houyundeii]|uniref:hypothetical protein n=1 Tax=Nocardioides houyundeii TaxID=2045452 RepID=UPI0013B3A473|nr:hypothetical protein [Nocardioides houyundeii]